MHQSGPVLCEAAAHEQWQHSKSMILCCCCCVAQVLGIAMPKSKKISMSNWERVSLTRGQIKYAALDVLMPGQVFRALRLWHSSPFPCEVCHYHLGAVSTPTVFTCSECDMRCGIRKYTEHCEHAGHKPEWTECEGCGCARQLPWPSSTAAAAAAAAAAAGQAAARMEVTPAANRAASGGSA
jgi:hypothetical protein